MSDRVTCFQQTIVAKIISQNVIDMFDIENDFVHVEETSLNSFDESSQIIINDAQIVFVNLFIIQITMNQIAIFVFFEIEEQKYFCRKTIEATIFKKSEFVKLRKRIKINWQAFFMINKLYVKNSIQHTIKQIFEHVKRFERYKNVKNFFIYMIRSIFKLEEFLKKCFLMFETRSIIYDTATNKIEYVKMHMNQIYFELVWQWNRHKEHLNAIDKFTII